MNSKKKKEIISKLLINEKEILEELENLIDISRDYVRLDATRREIILLPTQRTTNKENIMLYLIGAYFASELGLRENSFVTLQELSDELKVLKTTLSSPLGKLVNNKKILSENGLYKIQYFVIKDFLEDLRGD